MTGAASWQLRAGRLDIYDLDAADFAVPARSLRLGAGAVCVAVAGRRPERWELTHRQDMLCDVAYGTTLALLVCDPHLALLPTARLLAAHHDGDEQVRALRAGDTDVQVDDLELWLAGTNAVELQMAVDAFLADALR